MHIYILFLEAVIAGFAERMSSRVWVSFWRYATMNSWLFFSLLLLNGNNFKGAMLAALILSCNKLKWSKI